MCPDNTHCPDTAEKCSLRIHITELRQALLNSAVIVHASHCIAHDINWRACDHHDCVQARVVLEDLNE